MMVSFILLLTALITKHFIFDFMFQPPYQWQNKGTYGHLGGILHAGQHALATMVIVTFFITPAPLIILITMAFLIGLFEFLVHYHIDWFKMWYNKRKGWGANTHAEFWILLGLDQFLHYMTYVMIIIMVLL